MESPPSRGRDARPTASGHPDESGSWFVFGDDGTPLGRLEVPEDGRLLDMSDDALLVAVRGALDVEQVLLYDLAGGTELETESGGG